MLPVPSRQEGSLQLVLVKLPALTSGPASTDPGYSCVPSPGSAVGRGASHWQTRLCPPTPSQAAQGECKAAPPGAVKPLAPALQAGLQLTLMSVSSACVGLVPHTPTAAAKTPPAQPGFVSR